MRGKRRWRKMGRKGCEGELVEMRGPSARHYGLQPRSSTEENAATLGV